MLSTKCRYYLVGKFNTSFANVRQLFLASQLCACAFWDGCWPCAKLVWGYKRNTKWLIAFRLMTMFRGWRPANATTDCRRASNSSPFSRPSRVARLNNHPFIAVRLRPPCLRITTLYRIPIFSRTRTTTSTTVWVSSWPVHVTRVLFLRLHAIFNPVVTGLPSLPIVMIPSNACPFS